MTTPKPASKPKEPSPIEYVRANYGYLAGFLDIPELRNILLKAAQGKWDTAKLQGALYATSWWKKTAEVTRQWIALQTTDPATAKQRIAVAKQQIQTLAQQQGVKLTAQQLEQFAVNANKFGWSAQQVQSAVGHQFRYNPDSAATGQAALTIDKLKSIAADYLVPVSDATMAKWTRDVLSGSIDVESFVGYAQQQAKSRWPGLADAIDRGVTVAQYTDSYKQTIAQQLELDPDSINLADSRWSRVIDQVDPKTGVRSAMSLSDAATFARQQPEYARTANARQQTAQLTTFLGKTLGKIAG